MNLDKVFSRLAAAPHDQVELRRLARALGSELPRERIEVLRRFRAELALTPTLASSATRSNRNAPSYAQGYLTGMLDIAAEYENHVQQRETVARRHDDTGTRAHTASTLEEQHAAAKPTELSEDMLCGIRLAVNLLRQALDHETTTAPALDDMAHQVLDDPRAAAEAVSVWATEASRAGLIPQHTPERDHAGVVPHPIMAAGSEPVIVPLNRSGAPAPLPLHDHLRESSLPAPAGARIHEPSNPPWPRRPALTASMSAANDNDEQPLLGMDDLDATGVE